MCGLWEEAKGDHLPGGEAKAFPGSKDPKLEGESCHHDSRGILEYGLRDLEISFKKKKAKKALKSFCCGCSLAQS